jgi:hypothetical protein
MDAECVIAWETRDSVGIAQQSTSSGDQQREWTTQTVGAATCLLMKKESVAQGMSEDNTEAFSTKIDSMQVPFAPTMGADGDLSSSQAKYMSISRMQYYNKYSFEEIRVGDYLTQLARADRGEPASSMMNEASSAATHGPVAADKSTDDNQASSSVSIQPPGSVVLTQFYPGPGTVTKWVKTVLPDDPFRSNTASNGTYISITLMPAYQNYSFDELRVQDYGAGRTKGVLEPVACSGGLPQVGMTVQTISTQQGAPRGKSTLHFSTGQQITIKELLQEDGKWYAVGHEYSTLWFPLSSTDAYSGGVGGLGQPAAPSGEFGGFGQPAVGAFGALAMGGAFGAGGDGTQCLGWDPTVAAYRDGLISEDGSTVKCLGSSVSVRANRSFSSGTHTWRVRVSGNNTGIRLGIVSQLFSRWMEAFHAIGNDDDSFGFYSGNAAGSWHTAGTAPTFASGDVLELTLDLQEQLLLRTLTAHNVTQNSSKVVLCTGLPLAVAFYPAASVYNEGNLVQLLDAQELVVPPPFGQPYTIRIKGAGGATGTKCNGTYSEFGQHNGKPQYVQQGGTAKIYFDNFWKISAVGSTGGWCYGVDTPEGKGPYPPTVWRSDGYGGSDILPCPTLQYFCVGHQSTKGADASDPSGAAKSKESPDADCERIVGSVATCRRALSEKEPVIEFQIISPLVTPPPEPQSADTHVRQVPQEFHLGFSEESAPFVVEYLGQGVVHHEWKTREVEFRSGSRTIQSRQRCPNNKAAFYEIEIVSPVNNPQFGFCGAQFSPGIQSGTGDCKHSWAVDGYRGLLLHDGKQAWNLAHKWNVGDVIGIACDLVKGELSFSLNGSFAPPYGVLFSGVARNSQASASVDGLFASFTASSGKVRYNLGAPTPFKFSPPAPTELLLSREIFQPFSAFPVMALPPRPGMPISERVIEKAPRQSAGRGRNRQKAASPSSERVFPALEIGAASFNSTFGSVSLVTSADSAPSAAGIAAADGGAAASAAAPAFGAAPAASGAAPATGSLGSLGGAGAFDDAATPAADVPGGLCDDTAPDQYTPEEEEAERICEDVPNVQFCVSLVEADADAKCIASVSDDGTITLAGNPSFSVGDEVTLDPAAPLPASLKVSTPSCPSGPFPGAPPAPPSVISRDAVGKIIAILPADPDKGVGRMASVQFTVNFASAKALVPLRDMARKAPPKKTAVRKPGDRLGFAISRPWDGSDMEIAVVVNGDVVERFDYCPSSCARQADEPYARLMAFYADASASSKIDSNAAAATKISQHLAIIAGAEQAGGFGGFAGEEAVARDLASAKDGHVTPALSALLTWHEIFDKYAYRNAPCPEREIRAQGLALLVMDFMVAASLPLLDDMLLHEVHKCAGELRAAGLTSAGLNFEQFLTFAIANREAFEPMLKEKNLKKWSKKMNMLPSPDGGEPRDVSADPPSLHVRVWASGGKGSGHCGGIGVDELLRVATETQQQTLAVALGIASSGKAHWLSRCARVAMDTISSIVNASVDMPEVMTYQSPAKTTRVAGKGGTQASAPGAPQTAPAQAGATFKSSDVKLQKHLDAVDASAKAATATNNADVLRALDPNAGQWLNYLRTMYVLCLCSDNAAFVFARATRTRTPPLASGRLPMCSLIGLPHLFARVFFCCQHVKRSNMWRFFAWWQQVCRAARHRVWCCPKGYNCSE